jgi:hypothetical protein
MKKKKKIESKKEYVNHEMNDEIKRKIQKNGINNKKFNELNY